MLVPVTLVFAYGDLRTLSGRQLRLIAGAAVFLALHFATWIASLDFTSIANSVVLVTLNPVWLALYGLLILRMPPHRLTWISIALAVGGGVIIAPSAAPPAATPRCWATCWRSPAASVLPASCCSPSAPGRR